MNIYTRVCLLSFFFFAVWQLPTAVAQKKYSQLTAVAKKGDGIYTLLGRYNLSHSVCAFNNFCKLNKLTSKSHLMVGKTYQMPIRQYKYNQKSIRSTANIKEWKYAKSIEHYNDLMLEIGRKTSDFRTGKRELWVPYHLQYCPMSTEKFIPKNRNFPIFGEKYAHVPLEDAHLAGAVYYLVSGHGGPDPGAMAKYKGTYLCEDEYSYDITLRLARKLISHGAIVYIIVQDKNDGIRSGEILKQDIDEKCWGNKVIPIGQKDRLNQRSDLINKLYKENQAKGIEYQRMVEIHVDSRQKDKRIDLFFYHYPTSQTGKQLAEKLYKVMEGKYAINRKSGEYHGLVTSRDLHMLREVLPVPVFIEVGNIQNPNDQKRIIYPSNRQAIADWLAEGLMKDY